MCVVMTSDALPIYLTPDEAAAVLRTTRKAIYVKVERRQIPGVRRIGKKILICSAELVRWIEDQQDAHSLHGDSE